MTTADVEYTVFKNAKQKIILSGLTQIKIKIIPIIFAGGANIFIILPDNNTYQQLKFNDREQVGICVCP